MSKQHTSYSSAFALGEMAVLNIERFGDNKVPYGVVEGCMSDGEERRYRVSLFVNEGRSGQPEAYLHRGRPVDGFLASDLKAVTDQYIDHIGHVGRFERPHHKLGDSLFVAGQLVEININLGQVEPTDKFRIPVKIIGVSYVEGKVLYDVSIQRDYYNDGREHGGRLDCDTLSRIDSIYIEPADGWPQTCVEQEGDATLVIKGDGTVLIEGAADITISADSIALTPVVSGRTSGLVENQSAKPRSK